MNVSKWVFWLLMVGVFILLLPSDLLIPRPPKRQGSQARQIVKMIKTAGENYHAHYNRYPFQTHSNHDFAYVRQDIFKVLTSAHGTTRENQERVVFLDLPERVPNPNVDLLDPWGMPLRIIMDWNGDGQVTVGTNDVPVNIAVWSLGPNKRNDFGKLDDLTSW